MTLIFAIALLCSACSTTWTPLQGSLFIPVQVFSESTDVRGLRVNVLCGKNASVYGLDVGLANSVEERATGVQAGIVNLAGELDGIGSGFVNKVEERVRGIQLAGIANLAGELHGMQLSMVFNKSRSVVGVQLGPLFNEVEEHVRGIQLSEWINVAEELVGVQIAVIHNRAESVVGVQIGGLVNIADDLVGLQIGILNFNRSGPLPFFPIFNFGFGGASEESEVSED